MVNRFPAVLFIFFMAMTGCDSSELKAPTGVSVQVFDPFPPNDRSKDLHAFSLTDDELQKFLFLFEEFPEYTPENLDIGAPRFWFDIEYGVDKSLSGNFFRGPQKLTLDTEEGCRVYPEHNSRLHDYLVGLIQDRGWMESSPASPVEQSER